MPTSKTSSPDRLKPCASKSRKVGELSRASRPRLTRRAPWRLKNVPVARARSSTLSSVRSRPTTPRMSYSRKMCGFMGVSSTKLRAPIALERFGELLHVLRARSVGDQQDVPCIDDDQTLDAEQRHQAVGRRVNQITF